jgi:hypothetical protein
MCMRCVLDSILRLFRGTPLDRTRDYSYLIGMGMPAPLIEGRVDSKHPVASQRENRKMKHWEDHYPGGVFYRTEPGNASIVRNT